MKLAIAATLGLLAVSFVAEAQQTFSPPPAAPPPAAPPPAAAPPPPAAPPPGAAIPPAAPPPPSAAATAPGGCVRDIEGVEGGSEVTLNEPCSLNINGDIDGESRVNIASSGFIHLHGKIDGSSTAAFSAGKDIVIDDKIDGGSQVTLHAGTPGAPAPIAVLGKVDDGDTHVRWCGSGFDVREGIKGGARVDTGCP